MFCLVIVPQIALFVKGGIGKSALKWDKGEKGAAAVECGSPFLVIVKYSLKDQNEPDGYAFCPLCNWGRQYKPFGSKTKKMRKILQKTAKTTTPNYTKFPFCIIGGDTYKSASIIHSSARTALHRRMLMISHPQSFVKLLHRLMFVSAAIGHILVPIGIAISIIPPYHLHRCW